MKNLEHSNDSLMKRKEVMEMLRMRSVNTYYKFRRESGVKVMKISGGIEVSWKSDILKYLSDLQNHVA